MHLNKTYLNNWTNVIFISRRSSFNLKIAYSSDVFYIIFAKFQCHCLIRFLNISYKKIANFVLLKKNVCKWSNWSKNRVIPGKGFELKFIPNQLDLNLLISNQSDLILVIPKSVSELIVSKSIRKKFSISFDAIRLKINLTQSEIFNPNQNSIWFNPSLPIRIKKKKFGKNLEILTLSIFIYLKKKSVEIRLVFENKDRKKKMKIIFVNFLFFKKKSVNSLIKG